MNIEKTTIVLVPETGYKRTVALKLLRPIPDPEVPGRFMFKAGIGMTYRVLSKNARFAILIADGTGKTPREINGQINFYESRVDALKDYNQVVAYYKIIAFHEENPDVLPTSQNGGWYNGWKYVWPDHPWNK